MHVRHPDDRGGAAYHQHPPLPGTDPLHHEPRRGSLRAGEQRVRPALPGGGGAVGHGGADHPAHRRRGEERGTARPGRRIRVAAGRGSPRYDFPDFDENSIATTFYTTGTTGNPKGVYFSHRQLVLHTLAMASTIGSLDSIRLLGTSDVYMPITPMFHVHAWGTPYVATMLGVKQVYPGRTIRNCWSNCGSARRSPSPTACRPSCRW